MPNIKLVREEYSYSFKEEIKQIRTNIEYSGADNKVIMITSSVSGEGKSTIALELCYSFAELGKKTLLIDADMRKSTFHNKVAAGCQKPHGLSYFLSGQTERDNVLCNIGVENFHCIMAGRVPPNPSELLASKKMVELMTWARENYDVVIVDCPPTDLVVDSSVIAANYADAAVVVVKSNSVPRKMVQNVVSQLERVNCPIVGVVLSQVQESTRGYSKKYGYGYGYGYYGDAPDTDKFKKADKGSSEKKK